MSRRIEKNARCESTKDNLLGRIWPTGVKLGLYGDVVFESGGRVKVCAHIS